MLWIDNPVGTGFSYVMNASGYVSNETALAADLATALAAFMQRYPQYAKLPFYIFGESYGGKYVPWLADAIMLTRNTSSPLHVNGIGLGNGWVSPLWQTPSNPLYLCMATIRSLCPYRTTDTYNRITKEQFLAANVSIAAFLSLVPSRQAWLPISR